MMQKNSRIFVAGHRGLVGSALCRVLAQQGYGNLVLRAHSELDLTDRDATLSFFERERPEYVFLAAAKVGGILANDSYPADFIRENLEIQTSVIEAAYRSSVTRLLFLGSSCIYASREALDALNQRLHLFEPQVALATASTAKQARIKRFLKESIYNRLPFEISAALFFLYRYVLQLGFLDGRAGLIYHVLQGFWYRFLVGAKLRELELAVKQASSDEEMRSAVAQLTRQKLTAAD